MARDVLEQRPYRLLILSLTGAVGLVAVVWAAQLTMIVTGHEGGLAVDFRQYQDHVSRWFATGELYFPRQLAGPYSLQDGDPLYPPPILYLLIPFRVLPELLWWIIPIGITVVIMVSLRPAPWTWPILALIALWPRTPALILYANPGMWTVAFVALALRFPWAGPLILLKPSFGPLALIGAPRRSWFISLAIIGVAAIPFGTLWLDYIAALRNSQLSLTYSLVDLPLALAPIVCWLGRVRPANPPSAADDAR
jgi:hypothetical protein